MIFFNDTFYASFVRKSTLCARKSTVYVTFILSLFQNLLQEAVNVDFFSGISRNWTLTRSILMVIRLNDSHAALAFNHVMEYQGRGNWDRSTVAKAAIEVLDKFRLILVRWSGIALATDYRCEDRKKRLVS